MAFEWTFRTIDPLPIGGAARVWTRIEGADEVRVVIGSGPVTDPDVLLLDAVSIPLHLDARGWSCVVWGAHGATTATWFAKSGAGTWEAGPVDAVVLSFRFEAEFPLPTGWLVDRLSDYALGAPPLRIKPFAVSLSYPRDVSAWPMASVQVDEVSPSNQVIQNLLRARMTGGKRQIGSAYHVTFSIVCWCASPEDRRLITPWLAGALEAVRHCARLHPDLYEPSFTLSESEDFQTMGIPAFLVAARLSATVWSSLLIPESTTIGRQIIP